MLYSGSEDGASFVAVLYDSAGSFNSFYVWNESGYGSTDQSQHTSWWEPRYIKAGTGTVSAPAAWNRF